MTEETQATLPETETPAAAKAVKKARSGKPFLLSFLVLVLVLVAAAGAAGWYAYLQLEQIKQAQSDQQVQSNQIRQQLQQDKAQLTQQMNNHRQLIQELASRQSQLEQLANKSFEITHRSERGWILAEVDYLLRLAHRRLNIAADIHGAVAAMQGADSRLQELGDLSLFPVRKTIAKEIAKLQAVHKPDLNGSALKLDNMGALLPDLPFKSAQAEVQEQLEQPAPVETNAAPKPEGFVDSVLNTVMKIGDVKIHQHNVSPASSSQQQQAIEELLRSFILSARLALLRQDNTQFHHDIQQAQNLASQHYAANDNRVQNLLQDLKQLDQIDLQPQLPDITGAWSQLQKLQKPKTTPDATAKQEVSR